MARGRRRKCKCCQKLFRPDPCNRRHQRYCSAPRCRRASKIVSQARWIARLSDQRAQRMHWPLRRNLRSHRRVARRNWRTAVLRTQRPATR
jgi:hypothetical protein